MKSHLTSTNDYDFQMDRSFKVGFIVLGNRGPKDCFPPILSELLKFRTQFFLKWLAVRGLRYQYPYEKRRSCYFQGHVISKVMLFPRSCYFMEGDMRMITTMILKCSNIWNFSTNLLKLHCIYQSKILDRVLSACIVAPVIK